MNFFCALFGGIALAFALVELLPPDVLTPPDGSPVEADTMSSAGRVLIRFAIHPSPRGSSD
jgi:inorganic phosphate transporter, PiT family